MRECRPTLTSEALVTETVTHPIGQDITGCNMARQCHDVEGIAGRGANTLADPARDPDGEDEAHPVAK